MQRSAPIALQGDIEVPKKAPRAWVAAGVAIAGASVMAVAPGVHSEVPTAYKATEATVRLAADWKPLEPYIDAFNEASKNAATLAHNYFLAPGLPLQQIISNQSKYLNEVLNDPSKADDALKKMRANLEAVITGVTGIGASDDTLAQTKDHTVDGLHGLVLQLLPQFLPEGGPIDPATITAIMNVLASPMSGVLIGLVGPVISPAVAVLNSGIAIAAAIQAGNPDAVFSDVFSAPANVVGAVFNGATLDLTALTPIINETGLLGSTTLNSLDIAFGGLFTPGSVGRGSYDGPNGTSITAPGGSILNSVGMNVTTDALGFPLTLGIPGQAVGPIGAMEGLSQTVGVLLGDGWDGKSGKPVPPLAGVEFPTISDKASDNWAAAIQKLADTLLGKKDSETTPSPDTAKTAAAVATAGVAVESAKAESAKVDVAETESSSTQASPSAEAQSRSTAQESTAASPTVQPSVSQPSSPATPTTSATESSTAPAASADSSSTATDSTQGSASTGSSTPKTDADTQSAADSKSGASSSANSGESTGASKTSGGSTSSAGTGSSGTD
ncbi:outer membrane porin GjpA [Gordonia sputi]